MRLKNPYGTNWLRWDNSMGELRQDASWGYTKESGMTVLNCQLAGKPDLQAQVERELGVAVFNGAQRPRGIRAWSMQGHPVAWAELNTVWMIWDKDHDIILPAPTRLSSVVWPHPTARPHVLLRYRGSNGGFTLSKANRKRANEWVEFFKLIVMKGRLAGRPERSTRCTDEYLRNIMSRCPNLEEVLVEECQNIVFNLGLFDKVAKEAIDRIRALARDTWHSEYLSTWSKGRES